jgi:hypothetical protein
MFVKLRIVVSWQVVGVMDGDKLEVSEKVAGDSVFAYLMGVYC